MKSNGHEAHGGSWLSAAQDTTGKIKKRMSAAAFTIAVGLALRLATGLRDTLPRKVNGV
jgi:hypothetical protein